MSGKAMAQSVHGHALVDSGGLGGRMDRPVELTGAERFNRVEPGKEPAAVEHLAWGSSHSPPDPQPLKQDRREHGVSILLTFALFNAQRHALTVDVTDLQSRHFAGAQSCAIGNCECR